MVRFIFVFLLVFLNVRKSLTTPKNISTNHSISFNLEVAKKISQEIKAMNLPNVKIKRGKDFKNISLSTMKVQRIFTIGDVADTQFKLFTRNNTQNSLYLSAENSNLKECNFDHRKHIKIFIHGWLHSSFYEGCIAIKDAYLLHHDVNVILVDWNHIASNLYYPWVVAQTKPLGWHIGEFINLLLDCGCRGRNIHIIGHSLGSHISGFAAETARKKIGRITALDPALPGYTLNILRFFGGAGSITVDHASFVDVIHTNGGTLGIMDAVGHVDFFPNGGQIQPGCLMVDSMCSHLRSLNLWRESIDGNIIFPAKHCSESHHRSILMGEPTPKTARGRYCMNTNSKPPYGNIKRRRYMPARQRAVARQSIEAVEADRYSLATKAVGISPCIIMMTVFL